MGERTVLGFFAPLLGRSGKAPDVFEVLAPALVSRGYGAVSASSAPTRARRLVDQVRVLWRDRRHIDVVFIHVYTGPTFVVVDLLTRLGRRSGRPLVGYLSGGGIPDLIERHPRWASTVLGRFDLLSAPSGYLAGSVEAIGLSSEVVPNPVDITEFEFARRSPARARLLWMRTFHELYRPELAVEVLAALRAHHPDARLTMAGQDDGLLAPTRRLAERLGVADAVHFPGFIGPEARRRAFADHDVFLHTNRIDNMPLSLLQAGASGLPVVGMAVGGVPHLLADEREALLAPDSPDPATCRDGLVARVERVLADPSLAGRLSDAGREAAESARLPIVLDRWEELIAKLVADGPRPRSGSRLVT
jgi:glycosyltransferase involved in cell wall biosynthesis